MTITPILLLLLLLNPVLSATQQRTVSPEARLKCHTGVRDTVHRCSEYANLHFSHAGVRVKRQEDGEHEDDTVYPTINDTCLNITWENANPGNNWGNCMNMTTDETYRYITSNSVPDFYMNSYCPIGLGLGYCIQQEIDKDQCYFENMVCGADGNGAGSNAFGDVWVAQRNTYKIPLRGDPTRSNRPGDMYDARLVQARKTLGTAIAVAINGIPILGSTDAGDVSIDEAGFQLACGGHVTPPLEGRDPSEEGPSGAPLYHFHKAPECLDPFRNASIGFSRGAKPYEHGKLVGWAIDGFNIYSYQDIGGAAPIVDECGGHFGPVDGTGEVVYHYHARTIVPYHMACQGPSLGKCNDTQAGQLGTTNYCHPGCGFDVCVQPGTKESELKAYLDKQKNKTWIEQYTVNDYSGALTSVLSIHCVLVFIVVWMM